MTTFFFFSKLKCSNLIFVGIIEAGVILVIAGLTFAVFTIPKSRYGKLYFTRFQPIMYILYYVPN